MVTVQMSCNHNIRSNCVSLRACIKVLFSLIILFVHRIIKIYNYCYYGIINNSFDLVSDLFDIINPGVLIHYLIDENLLAGIF